MNCITVIAEYMTLFSYRILECWHEVLLRAYFSQICFEDRKLLHTFYGLFTSIQNRSVHPLPACQYLLDKTPNEKYWFDNQLELAAVSHNKQYKFSRCFVSAVISPLCHDIGIECFHWPEGWLGELKRMQTTNLWMTHSGLSASFWAFEVGVTYVVTIISQPGIVRITSTENVRVWGTGSENEIILYAL